MDAEQPWLSAGITAAEKDYAITKGPTVLERLSALESHIPRINKELSRLNERLDELVRLLGA